MTINLYPEIFNPLFFKLLKSTKRFQICWGGRGSGKSYSIAQYIIYNCTQRKEKYVVYRSTLVSHSDTTLSLFTQILKEWKIWKEIEHNKNEKRFIFPNGSEIVLKGLDDPEKSKGLEGTTSLWFEEITSVEFKDFSSVNSALRGKQLKKPQVLISFNPIDETHWCKKMLFDTEAFSVKAEYYHSTCLDNKFLSKDDIENLKALKEYDYNQYKIEYEGLWGKTNRGGEFYPKFNPTKQVTDLKYNSNEPLHISFDENVNPYLSVIVSQISIIENETTVNIIDEITIEGFNLEDVCKEFKKRYPNIRSGLFIYGDSTSMKQDSKLERGYNFFTLIQSYLSDYKPQLMVSRSNPSVVMAGNYLNKVFYEDDTVKIRIDYKCRELISDLENCKVNAEGKKDKRVVRNKNTGVSYQAFGHTSDCLTYFLTQALNEKYFEFQNGGSSFNPIIKKRPNFRY